jgi:CheY-like chemotaxis protein
VNRTVLRQVLMDLLECALFSASRPRILVTAVASGESVAIEVLAPSTGSRGNAAGIDADGLLMAVRRLVELQGGVLTTEFADGCAFRARLLVPGQRTRTLLVVDDNPDVAFLFARFLEGRGYSVRHASTGAGALELARQLRPDAITLDVLMPSQDGWDTLQRLSADPATKGVPVIMCSVIPERSLALSLGVRCFLNKPVTADALYEVLERCVPAAA